ncbi:hypothetical protein ACH79_05745 [Bradyrhizobium sp. CCBAU 051011]|nr:hypothetical protein ACH79_05745 [Bradyrhizobium sp. CCBAU 051011]
MCQGPALSWAVLAAAVAAMVEIYDLGDVGQGGVGWLVNRMIEARTAVEEQQGGLFLHGGPIRDQLRPLDIEEQAHSVHGYVHEWVSLDL